MKLRDPRDTVQAMVDSLATALNAPVEDLWMLSELCSVTVDIGIDMTHELYRDSMDSTEGLALAAVMSVMEPAEIVELEEGRGGTTRRIIDVTHLLDIYPRITSFDTSSGPNCDLAKAYLPAEVGEREVGAPLIDPDVTTLCVVDTQYQYGLSDVVTTARGCDNVWALLRNVDLPVLDSLLDCTPGLCALTTRAATATHDLFFLGTGHKLALLKPKDKLDG